MPDCRSLERIPSRRVAVASEQTGVGAAHGRGGGSPRPPRSSRSLDRVRLRFIFGPPLRRTPVAGARAVEIRDPIHGFIGFDDWEREIIAHPVMQRLRRIRQLGWTEMVYPGAVHTRFEHSLGVMHVAERMLEQVWSRSRGLLQDLDFTKSGIERDRKLVRLAALLHDVGHSPFSHVGEGLMPTDPKRGKPYKHEDYSAAIIREIMRDVIEDHPINCNYGISASEIADLIENRGLKARQLFLRQIISGQLDADRADYLLRDAHHVGVEYGRYDLNRLLVTLKAVRHPETGAPMLAVDEGGAHAAEGLIWARFQMFTQVYFHKTRIAYDHHVNEAMRVMLNEAQAGTGLAEPGAFPPPTSRENLSAYLRWTDWRVLGCLEAGGGGEHGEILRRRRHYRMVYQTPNNVGPDELSRLETIRSALGDLVLHVGRAEASWYKAEGEILIATDWPAPRNVVPLSVYSTAVAGLRASNKRMLYVAAEKKSEARAILDRLGKGGVA